MFFKIIMVCSFFAVSQCCSCMRPSINSSYCTADIVAKVNVTKVTFHGQSQVISNSEYEVEYLEIFKKPANFSKEHDIIKTFPTGGACGVSIDVEPNGVIYLLSISNSSIALCDINEPWKDDFKKELQAMAKHNCKSHPTPKPH